VKPISISITQSYANLLIMHQPRRNSENNSTDLYMGRRPMYKSDEFSQSTSLVDQISLMLLLCLWSRSTVEQVLHLLFLGAGVYYTCSLLSTSTSLNKNIENIYMPDKMMRGPASQSAQTAATRALAPYEQWIDGLLPLSKENSRNLIGVN